MHLFNLVFTATLLHVQHLKETGLSLHRVWYTGGSLTQRRKGASEGNLVDKM